MTPFDEVWFDCDSTLCGVEGVDELGARRPEVAKEIAALTCLAMDGKVALEDVYARRLAILAPTRDEIEALAGVYVARLSPDAADVVGALRAAGKRAAIVSGGLKPAVLGCARAIGVADHDVHAVDMTFGADGRYLDFDRASPLARSGGKAELLRSLARPGVRRALVGDGATDLEAAPEVDLFVGYGGVVARDAVRLKSPVWLGAPSLAPLLLVVLSEVERSRLRADARFRNVLARADALSSTVVRAPSGTPRASP
jgi:phosphoserine phosphatase